MPGGKLATIQKTISRSAKEKKTSMEGIKRKPDEAMDTSNRPRLA